MILNQEKRMFDSMIDHMQKVKDPVQISKNAKNQDGAPNIITYTVTKKKESSQRAA
jgi:hypothetical protein